MHPDSVIQLSMSGCTCTGELVEINANLVLFCFFKPAEGAPHQERCLILKFLHTRLLTQSEQFANELTRHLDICAPTCRILRQKVCLLLPPTCVFPMVQKWLDYFSHLLPPPRPKERIKGKSKVCVRVSAHLRGA